MKTTVFKAIRDLMFLFIVMMAFSCQQSSQYKIGFLEPNMQAKRYQKEKEFFIQKMNELGGEAIVTDANYDEKLQLTQAEAMIKEGVKVLVVNAVNVNTAAQIVREAHNAHIKVIAYDRLIRNADVDYYLSFDNVKVGKLMAEYVVREKPEGNYILFGGDKSDNNAVLVKKGQMEVLEPYIKSGKIVITYNIFIEDWSGVNAAQEMKKYLDLSGKIPDVILTSYDGLATETIKVLDTYHLAGKILLTGQDAELDACRNIVRGKQAMTVFKPFRTQVNAAASLAMKCAQNKEISEAASTINNGKANVPAILLEPIAVDKNNIRNTIIADKYYTEAEIYQ
ncbi:MAG: substrate-binding domain-containing protein [Bacteroidota bacterium]|nr:substrate-binding domain-containing protein [Bacteroidota bacterium]MDP4227019.1 substrate-binding domain-containing protein [Bacteroidota bacterium]MDP4272950.1 substrate-binding domain-containing protein [Bacteroidota bacterium]